MYTLQNLFDTFGLGSDDEPRGADAIAAAIYERSQEAHPEIGGLGEPRMVDRGGQYSNSLKIIVPVTLRGGYTVPNLEFSLPDGLDDETALFYDFLDEYGIEDVANLADLDGAEIHINWSDGTPVPEWR